EDCLGHWILGGSRTLVSPNSEPPLAGESFEVCARIPPVNPPLTPPRRGTDRTRTNACSPLGRGRGWVGSWKASFRFGACIGTRNRGKRRPAGRTPSASRSPRRSATARQRLECVELAPAFARGSWRVSFRSCACTGTMNPPLTPPRRGTDRTRTDACSPPGRGRGWVGSWRASALLLAGRFGLRFRREPEHDVEFGGQLPDSRAFDRREIDGHGIPCSRVLDAHINPVTFVLRLAFDVTLSGPLVASLHFNGEMNVAGASGVEHRFDGAEVVFTRRASQKASESLEVRVARGVFVAAVQINAVVVHLPDLDECVADGLSFGVQDTSFEVGDLTDGGVECVVDNDVVVVGVEREVIGVGRY